MRLGRLSAGLIDGPMDFDYMKGACECHILSIGLFYIIWTAKTCKCQACGQYDCTCRCPLCGDSYLKCECESFE